MKKNQTKRSKPESGRPESARPPKPRTTNARNARPSTKNRSRATRWEADYEPCREGEWFIAGINGVNEALASPHISVKRLWLDPASRNPQLAAFHRAFDGPIEPLDGKDTPYGPSAQGVAALVREPNWGELEDWFGRRSGDQPPFLIALDQVEDPMNLGQILRTCEGVGVDGVILLRHRSIHLNQTVAQVSQGAFAWVPVFEVTNLRNALEMLKEKEMWVIGCEGDAKAQPWNKLDFTTPLVLVFGAEGRGLRDLTRKTCDALAALPMKGRINSLNVGAAVSAFVYEVARQRA